MPSKLKSNRPKSKKFDFISKLKQLWQIKQPTSNWLELPSDLMVNILQRISVLDRLKNAQRVCTAWRQICMDPIMWRVVQIERLSVPFERFIWQEMCEQAVDRSQGLLLDLTVIGFSDNAFLQYVLERSSQLRRLEVVKNVPDFYEVWSEAFQKLPLLEELSLVESKISKADIEAVGRYCPLLKTLKLNQRAELWVDIHDEVPMIVGLKNEIAVAIGKNLPDLTHLELIGNSMTNIGLQAILDGCCKLESLDIRWCLYLDLKGDLRKRCLQQIKYLKLSNGSLEDFPYKRYV